MWKDIELKKLNMRRKYGVKQRYTLQVNFIPYMDEVAEQIGCRPDIRKCTTTVERPLAHHSTFLQRTFYCAYLNTLYHYIFAACTRSLH